MSYARLQYISQGHTATEQLEQIRRVLDQGINWVQVRWKGADRLSVSRLVQNVQLLQQQYAFTLLLNDDAGLAQELGADGVHLGLSDQPVAEARALLDPEKIIGGTANTLADIHQRIREGCQYIGLGPFRFTRTKAQLSPLLGLEGYRQLMTDSLVQDSGIPIYAIGGITPDDIPELMRTGIYGIAASSMLHQHDAATILQHINTGTHV